MMRIIISAVAAVAIAAGCTATSARPAHPPDATPVLWQDSAPAAPGRQPTPPYRFIEEDMQGDSPKFSVRDGNGTEWQVKLGPEAQPETAAVRIVSAAGYFVEDVRYFASVQVEGLPRLKRGAQFVTATGTVRSVRFEARRSAVERGATWDFAANPFVGTRELDGLKVLMVLINNYDARTENNRIFIVNGADGRRQARYLVADLGASFGRYGGMGGTRSKNDLQGYRASRFIDRVDGGTVHFAYTTRPQGVGLSMFVLNPIYVRGELKKQRDLRTVPVTAARWIGQRLAGLNDGVLQGAFEEAGYDRTTGAGFLRVLRERITQLAAL